MHREVLLEEEVQRLLLRDGEVVPLPKQADFFFLVVADYLHQGANLLGQFCLCAESAPRVTSHLMNKG